MCKKFYRLLPGSWLIVRWVQYGERCVLWDKESYRSLTVDIDLFKDANTKEEFKDILDLVDICVGKDPEVIPF